MMLRDVEYDEDWELSIDFGDFDNVRLVDSWVS